MFIDVLNLIVQLPEPAFESPSDSCRRNTMLNAKRAKVGDGIGLQARSGRYSVVRLGEKSTGVLVAA